MPTEVQREIVSSVVEVLKDLSRLKGVNGFSRRYQFRIKDGVPTREICIRVYVEKKRPAWFCKLTGRMIPKEIAGIRTDVYPLGKIRIQSLDPHKTRQSILAGGQSFIHYKVSAATLGLILRDKTTKQPTMLSNLHVIWDIDNPGLCAQQGDNILQPGPLDGGSNPSDTVATADKAIPLDFTGQENLVDAATALWNGARQIRPAAVMQNDGSFVQLVGYKLAVPSMAIKGCSRNGDLDVVVVDIDAQTQVSGYGCKGEGKIAWFMHVVVYTPSLGGGSSGTIMYDPVDRKVVALNFAGSGNFNQPDTFGIGGRMHVIMESAKLNLEWPPEEQPPKRYAPSEWNGSYEVISGEERLPSRTEAQMSSSTYHEGDPVGCSGRLVDDQTNTGISGKQVSWTSGTQSGSVTTVADGTFAISFAAGPPGTYGIRVYFEGDT